MPQENDTLNRDIEAIKKNSWNYPVLNDAFIPRIQRALEACIGDVNAYKVLDFLMEIPAQFWTDALLLHAYDVALADNNVAKLLFRLISGKAVPVPSTTTHAKLLFQICVNNPALLDNVFSRGSTVLGRDKEYRQLLVDSIFNGQAPVEERVTLGLRLLGINCGQIVTMKKYFKQGTKPYNSILEFCIRNADTDQLAYMAGDADLVLSPEMFNLFYQKALQNGHVRALTAPLNWLVNTPDPENPLIEQKQQLVTPEIRRSLITEFLDADQNNYPRAAVLTSNRPITSIEEDGERFYDGVLRKIIERSDCADTFNYKKFVEEKVTPKDVGKMSRKTRTKLYRDALEYGETLLHDMEKERKLPWAVNTLNGKLNVCLMYINKGMIDESDPLYPQFAKNAIDVAIEGKRKREFRYFRPVMDFLCDDRAKYKLVMENMFKLGKYSS